MLAFDAGAVLKAVGTLRSLESGLRHYQDNEKYKKTDIIDRKFAHTVLPQFDGLRDAVTGLNARATSVAIQELRNQLTARKFTLTYKLMAELISDIAVTLRRELSLIKTFCVEPNKEYFFAIDVAAFGLNFKTAFASAVFEIDEAGKCHALSRSTACVFHLMRAMEIGIKAVARSLGIPDPVKPSDRNWGNILKTIKDELDRRNAAKQWKKDDRELFEALYVSLDAVRVAWRNTTMHVENKYTDDESEHIFVAVRGFMKKLSSRMDEDGKPLA